MSTPDPRERPDPATMTSAELVAEFMTWQAIAGGMSAIGQGQTLVPPHVAARIEAIIDECDRRPDLGRVPPPKRRR